MAKPEAKIAAKPVKASVAAPVMAEITSAETLSPAAVSAPAIPTSTLAAPEITTQQSLTGPARPITWEDISLRAYFIAISGYGGSEDDNWHRAEAELKREAGLL